MSKWRKWNKKNKKQEINLDGGEKEQEFLQTLAVSGCNKTDAVNSNFMRFYSFIQEYSSTLFSGLGVYVEEHVQINQYSVSHGAFHVFEYMYIIIFQFIYIKQPNYTHTTAWKHCCGLTHWSFVLIFCLQVINSSHHDICILNLEFLILTDHAKCMYFYNICPHDIKW